MAPEVLTARFLLDKGLRPERPGERLRDAILARLAESERAGATRAEALQELYPSTLLDDEVLERVTAALVSGSNVLLLGPPGSGKTSLAKDIWNLFPKDVIVVADCPVHDDPFSLIDPAFAREIPPCPHCRAKHGSGEDFDPAQVDPAKVPVRRARLREGYGLARLQGSPEVFPDYLTGAINIAKLEEIGDPESPLVIEPGKLMQANRGLLLVDEVGKLPRGTQNVLLQAFQESIVTPSKSRETFPAAFVAVTTSNLDDLDSINEPLTGRLTSVFVGFNRSHEKNLAIVARATRDMRSHVPGPLKEAAVNLAERWRQKAEGAADLAEVGSNRTMIDVLRRAEAHAMLAGAETVDVAAFERGAREAMQGRVRGRGSESFEENRSAVDAFLAKEAKEAIRRAAVAYWCDFFSLALKDDKAEAERVIREVREVVRDPRRVVEALSTDKHPKFRKWADYAAAREGPGPQAGARVTRVWEILEASKAFE